MLLESLQGKNDDILKYNIVLQISSFNLYLKLIFKSNIFTILSSSKSNCCFFYDALSTMRLHSEK